MTTPRGPQRHDPGLKLSRSERYSFHVGEKTYSIQFLPMFYLEDYDERQLAALAATTAYEVSYRLEDYALPDGSIIAGYGSTGTGDAFRVLGAVANGIMDWAKIHQPTFLFWYAQGPRAQRVYDRMIRYFNARGSLMRRCAADPFTRRLCRPEVFWLERIPSHPRPLNGVLLCPFSSRYMPHHNGPVHHSVRERSRNGITPFALALRGDVPRIESVGILAAANPGDQRLSVSENRHRFQDLRRDLLVYGMHQVRGHFGGFVDPLIVANLTRASLISLGAKYGQARVIFGAREAEGEQTAMRFALLDPEAHKLSVRGHLVAARKVFLTADERAPGGTDGLGKNASQSFVIPGFETAGGANDARFRGARVFSYQREEIPDTPEVQAVLARFLARDRLLVETLGKVSKGENIAQHVLYNRRGDQNLRLVELHKLLGNWERFPTFSYEDKW